MSGSSASTLIFLDANSTFTSQRADTIVSGGSDTITMLAPGALGFGRPADLIVANAADTITAALPNRLQPTAAETIIAAGQGAFVWSGGANTVINAGGADSVVSQPRQLELGSFSVTASDTIFAAVGGGTYFIQGGTFIAGSSESSTVVGSASTILTGLRFSSLVAPVIFGGRSNVLYFAQPIGESAIRQLGAVFEAPTFQFNAQSGNSTIVSTTNLDTAGGFLNTGAGIGFAENNGVLNLDGPGSGNQLIVGSGSETINAVASTGYNTFFAGSGNSSLVGGSGADAPVNFPSSLANIFTANLFEAGSGSTTMVGGTGKDWFEFTAGHTGGSDLIRNWSSADQLDFFGYGARPIASQAVNGGSTSMTLTDGTRITFDGIANVNPAQIVII